jgi:hypothetical protein
MNWLKKLRLGDIVVISWPNRFVEREIERRSITFVLSTDKWTVYTQNGGFSKDTGNSITNLPNYFIEKVGSNGRMAK